MDFDAPMLTFNPGLTQDMGTATEFTDVREVAAALDGAGVEPVARPEPGTGPAHLVVLDPDGHRILVDQFVDAPGSGSSPVVRRRPRTRRRGRANPSPGLSPWRPPA